MKRPEQIAHKAIADHLRVRAVPELLWWHTPNNIFAGGRRNRKGIAIQASIMKGLGMRTGVADFIMIHGTHALALELKPEWRGRPGEAQLQFLCAGGFGCVAEGLDRALKVLEAWGLLPGHSIMSASKKQRFAPLPLRALRDLRLGVTHLRTLGIVAAFDRMGKNGSGWWASQKKIARQDPR